MYYLVFGLLYVLSLLPWAILYALSDLAFVIIYYIIGYRKEVVADNLRHAFPEKTEEERKKIAKKFYQSFCDNWIETIKLLSISKNGIRKRISGDVRVLNEAYQKGKAAQANFGHVFNWEMLNLYLGIIQPYTILSVYFPPKSQSTNRLMQYVRSHWGNVVIATNDLPRSIIPWRRKQYLIGLGGDQSITHPLSSYWLNFMNRPACFAKGSEKYARGQQIPLVMPILTKPKRGHYYFEFILLAEAEELNHLPEGELMRRYIHKLEENIRLQPELYLWSHRRWKHPWKAEYEKLWIGDDAVPEQDDCISS